MRENGSKKHILRILIAIIILTVCGCGKTIIKPEANAILIDYISRENPEDLIFSKIELYEYEGYYYFYTEYTEDSHIETNEFTVLFIFDVGGGWVMDFNPNLDDLLDWKPYYDDYIEAKKLGTYKFYNQEELAEISNLINTPLEN